MIAFLLAAAVTASQPCTTVQPSPAFVCVNGGWLPPGHPGIPKVDPPPPVVDPTRFRVGRRYVRTYESAAPTDLFIAGTGQLPDGNTVLFATCLAVGDGCFAVNYVRVIPANANANDFTEVPIP